ncbi:uncharacterized protein A1O9_05141 [Exophiala aquamarina CBS 119918]|uniref:Mitochondrial intermediate peptidase n=1 Tax=Exophiala aquamarina CBS 119918 TaxID=1182545 RepID=A0A072PXJ0_9EURO|nr:uncharacterized protein A1O9_05141 [Exophiala aquamarina CBS 119918]KEF60290.1 hypothetical protein A1O9_05141 [Exophiala aquamarina CBS 119918]
MHKVLRRTPWTCAKCLRAAKRRSLTSAASATASTHDNSFESAYLQTSPSRSSNNTLLRELFNNKAVTSPLARNTSGLIGNYHLTSPKGFQKFAEVSVAQCKRLVERTLAASTLDEYKAIPRDLDRLSDLLCRVIDLSDFIRTIHPNEDVVAAATASYSLMLQYMNELNTTTGLNQQLRIAMDTPEVCEQWNAEEKMVAQLLFKDFAKSGIDLPGKQRKEFVSLSNEIAQVGTDFVNQMDHAKQHVVFSGQQLAGVDPTMLQGLRSWDRLSIPVYSHPSKVIMSSASDPVTRKEMYMAERTASKRTVARLEQLLLLRAQLAQVTGHTSYAQMTLGDKMSKSPEAVINFLESLNKSNKPQVQAELKALLDLKRGTQANGETFDPWDHPYLLKRLTQLEAQNGPRTSRSRLHDSAKSFFALGHVMQGLSGLFESLYGVRLVPKETAQGEVWHPEVRRLDVYTDKEEHIATMYCDLFSRPSKLPNPAHFTLLCSREISDEEIRECQEQDQPLNNGMPTLLGANPISGNTAHHQIPIIALVCGFPDPSGSTGPSLLSLHSVTTLFHEMGHAIHSILGRTSLQGISGTRCATDFAELPSVLMEYFATDPTVLKSFARHWKTDAVIPDEMLETLAAERYRQAAKTGGWNNEAQILMALLDQVYHSDGPVQAISSGRYNSTAVYHDVWNRFGSVPEPPQTAWQGFFGHLYGYGASYYSYLFDRAIARQVWRAVFRDGEDAGAVDRAAGERFKEEVLRWGGGRDPWLCLEGLLGEGRGVLAEGGEAAMLEVGKWGVGASSEGSM